MSNARDDTLVAPRLALQRIAQMNLDDDSAIRLQSIVDAPGVMSEGTWIDDDCVMARFMDPRVFYAL